MSFEWDPNKDKANQRRHGISFEDAKKAFWDPQRLIAMDIKHSTDLEKRYFCFGKVNNRVLTVRFTYRNDLIRIFGAGFWREGRKKYENQ